MRRGEASHLSLFVAPPRCVRVHPVGQHHRSNERHTEGFAGQRSNSSWGQFQAIGTGHALRDQSELGWNEGVMLEGEQHSTIGRIWV